MTTSENSPSGSNPDEARAFLEANPEIEAFDIVLTDSNGVGRGKIIRRHELTALYEHGRHLPISILGLELPLLLLWFVLATVLSTITERIRDWNVMTDELVWERLAISVGQWHAVLPRLHGVLLARDLGAAVRSVDHREAVDRIVRVVGGTPDVDR